MMSPTMPMKKPKMIALDKRDDINQYNFLNVLKNPHQACHHGERHQA